MKPKTCGECRAFDSGVCRRRSPLTDNQWPQVEKNSWCLDFLSRADETGWLFSYPSREKMMWLCDGTRDRMAIAKFAVEVFGAEDVHSVVDALMLLTREGMIRSSLGIYYRVEPKKTSAKPVKPRWTNKEVADLFPIGAHMRMPIGQIQKMAEAQLLMPSKDFGLFRFNLLTDGVIQMNKDGMYYRE